VALADVVQCLLAVHVVHARRPRVPLVVRGLGDRDVDAAELVGEGLEAGEVGDHDVVDVDAGHALDGADHEARTAPAERGVDLGLAVAGHGHPAVPGDRDDVGGLPVGLQVDQHDRVGALRAVAPLLRVAGVDPAVRAEQEHVHRARGGGVGHGALRFRDGAEGIPEALDVPVVAGDGLPHGEPPGAGRDDGEGDEAGEGVEPASARGPAVAAVLQRPAGSVLGTDEEPVEQLPDAAGPGPLDEVAHGEPR
jgi:hypothetical protein